jgi:hypothetical protein
MSGGAFRPQPLSHRPLLQSFHGNYVAEHLEQRSALDQLMKHVLSSRPNPVNIQFNPIIMDVPVTEVVSDGPGNDVDLPW